MAIILEGSIRNSDIRIFPHEKIEYIEALFFILYFAKILWHLTEDEVIRIKANLLGIRDGNKKLLSELEGTNASQVKFKIEFVNQGYKFKFTNWLKPDIHTQVLAISRFYVWLIKQGQTKASEIDFINKLIEHTIFGYLQIGGQTMSKHVFVDIPEKVTISNTSSDTSVSQKAFAQLVDTLCVKDTGK